MINNNIAEATCPRHEKDEILDYVIKSEERNALRKEFIKDLVVELVKNKSDDVYMEQIILFMEDILRFAENKEEEGYEMNQQYLGISDLFQEYVII